MGVIADEATERVLACLSEREEEWRKRIVETTGI
jgi:hypothetical protein